MYLIFVRYLTRSTKSATKSNRAGMNVTRRHVLKLQTPLPSKDVVLEVTHKTQLIKLIVQYLLDHLEDNDNELITSEEPVPTVLRNGKISKRDALYNVHEEADVIVNQLVYLADQGARNILVVCDDTDVFILLIYFFCGKDLSCGVIMESPVPGRTVVDIKATADKHKHIVEHLPGSHALSGCDTSYFFSIGKAAVLKVLNSGKSMKQLGMADVDMVDIISEAQSFMSMCYNVENDGNMSETRYKVWLARMAKVNICSAPKLVLCHRLQMPSLNMFTLHTTRP